MTEVSQAELMSQLREALDSGDFKLVAKLSTAIAKEAAATEKSEREAKLAELSNLTLDVKAAIELCLEQFDWPEVADGVWFSQDFGENLVTCRLVKRATVARTGGGGTGKKFATSSKDLLEQYGDEDYKDGLTFREAWEADTNGQARYKVRTKMLKHAGLV